MTVLNIATDLLQLAGNAHRSRDWIDYATLAITALAATGTLAAVLVALFGGRWNANRRRPLLSVVSKPPAMSHSRPKTGDPIAATEFSIELGNAAERDTAYKVEVFLSYARAVTEDTAIGGPSRVLLKSGVSVPANFDRPIPLLVLGTDRVIDEHLNAPETRSVTTHHTVAVAAVTPYGSMWLDPASYDFSIIVTGSNFDAKRFDGALRISRSEAEDRVATMVRWEVPLAEVAIDAPGRRPSPTSEDLKRAEAESPGG